MIVNSRTGTVVINSTVRVSPAAVSHGNLVVTISENNQVSQPNPLSGGRTVTTPQSDVAVRAPGDRRMFVFSPGVTLDTVVRAVNQVGAGPATWSRSSRPEAGRCAQGRPGGDLRRRHEHRHRHRSTPTSPASRRCGRVHARIRMPRSTRSAASSNRCSCR